MNRNHRHAPYGAKMLVGTTNELLSEASRGVVPGRLFVNIETEVVSVQLPSGTLQVLKTTNRPRQPDALSKPVITGPTAGPIGTPITLHAHSSVQSFINPNTEIEYYWYTGYDLVNVGSSYNIVPIAPIGAEQTIGCCAIDDFNNTSLLTYFTITTGDTPVVRPFMNDLPATLNYGETGTFYIDPGTDQYGSPYTAVVSSTNLLTITGVTTFDVTTWMTYTATNDFNLYGDSNNPVDLQLSGVTLVNEHVSAFVGVANNQPPNASTITNTLPDPVHTSEVFTFSVDGAIDPEGQPITYTVESLDSDITLTGNTDISGGATITGTVNSDPTIAPKSVAFSVIAKDIQGAQSAAVTITTNIITDPSIVFDYAQFAHDLVDEETVGISTMHQMGGMTVTVDSVVYVVQYNTTATKCTPPSSITPEVQQSYQWTGAGVAVITVTPYIGTLNASPIAINVDVISGILPPNLDNLTGIPTSIDSTTGLTPTITGAVDPEGGIVTMVWSSADSGCIPLTVSGGSMVNGESVGFDGTGSNTNCSTVITVIGTSSVSGLSTSRTFNIDSVHTMLPLNFDAYGGVPSSLLVNTNDCYVIAGITDPEGGDIDITITSADNTCVNASGSNPFNPGTCVVFNAGASDCTVVVTLIAVSSISGLSTTRTHTINVNSLEAPVLTGITGLPNTMDNNSAIQATIAGITDPEGGTISYVVTTASPGCVTSLPASTYANGDTVPFTSSIMGGCTAVMTLTATSSSSSLSNSIDFNIVVGAADGLDLSALSGFPTNIDVGDAFTGAIGGGVDPEGGTISYSVSSDSTSCLPAPSGFNDGGSVTLNAGGGECAGGTVILTVIGTSSVSGLTAQKTFNVLLNPAMVLDGSTMVINTANSILTDDQGVPFSVSGVSDASGGNNVTYAITNVSPWNFYFATDTGLTNNQQAPYNDTLGNAGNVTISVQATDNLGNTSTIKTKVVTVTQSNVAPVCTPITVSGPSIVYVGGSGTYTLTTGGTDANGDTLAHTYLVGNGNGSGSVTLGGTFTIYPTTVGSAPLTITATDGTLSCSKTVLSISIQALNQPPDMSGMTISGPTTLNTNETGVFSFTPASDPNGDTLTYSAQEYGAMGSSTLTVYPYSNFSLAAGSSTGNGGFTITATDNSGATGDKSHNISVVQNSPPNLSSASITAPWILCQSGSVSLNGASDPDGGALTWKILSLTSTTPFNIPGSTAIPVSQSHSYTANVLCDKFHCGKTYTVRVTLIDEQGLEVTRDFDYVPASNPPVSLTCDTTLGPIEEIWAGQSKTFTVEYPCAPHTDANIVIEPIQGFTPTTTVTGSGSTTITVTAGSSSQTGKIRHYAKIGECESDRTTTNLSITDGSEQGYTAKVINRATGFTTSIFPEMAQAAFKWDISNSGSARLGWTGDIYHDAGIGILAMGAGSVSEILANTSPGGTHDVRLSPFCVTPYAGLPSNRSCHIDGKVMWCHVMPPSRHGGSVGYVHVDVYTDPSLVTLAASHQADFSNYELDTQEAWGKLDFTGINMPAGTVFYVAIAVYYQGGSGIFASPNVLLDPTAPQYNSTITFDDPDYAGSAILYSSDTTYLGHDQAVTHNMHVKTKHAYYYNDVNHYSSIGDLSYGQLTPLGLSIAGNIVYFDDNNYKCNVSIPANGISRVTLTMHYGGAVMQLDNVEAQYRASYSLLMFSGHFDFANASYTPIVTHMDAWEPITPVGGPVGHCDIRWYSAKTVGHTYTNFVTVGNGIWENKFQILITFTAV